MKPRVLIIRICLTLCVLTIAGVAVQGRRLDALRAEDQQLRLEIQKFSSDPARPDTQPDESSDTGTRPSTSPSSELLRLRNQVSMLSRRQRELAAVPAENERLRARLTEARTNAANTLPPDYIRKSEARSVGYATPENTLQTMLWALQNRDFASLRASFTPEKALELDEELERTGKSAEQFFEGADAFPGMSIVSRNSATNDLVELQVEIVPGQDSQTLQFRLINGEWKMDSH